MTGAMYAGVSGLRAHMTALNVIGHNIANVNTLGYKSVRYTFNEALYTNHRAGSDGSLREGGVNPAQYGYGASIGTIDLDMSTKTYTPTGLATDCMIDGDGFFILGDKTKALTGVQSESELQGMTLSRLGNFGFDSQGWLCDGNGEIVYGFLCTGYDEATETYTYSPTLTAIRLPRCLNYEVEITGDGDDEDSSTEIINTQIFYPSVSEEDGYTLDQTSLPTEQPEGVTDNEWEAMQETWDSMQANGQTELTTVSLSSISIDSDGRITGISQDDQIVCVGLLAIAKVDNPNGVTHEDGRYFKALGGAGKVHLCSIGGNIAYDPYAEKEEGEYDQSMITVESSGDTKLVTGGLESSGTDLATEISNMIVIQRGYQANTRIVTVTDSMLEELVNMKR